MNNLGESVGSISTFCKLAAILKYCFCNVLYSPSIIAILRLCWYKTLLLDKGFSHMPLICSVIGSHFLPSYFLPKISNYTMQSSV